MVLVEKSAGEVQSRSTLIKTLPNGCVSKGLNGFVFVGSEEVLDVLVFEDGIKDDFLDELEELMLVSLETRDA